MKAASQSPAPPRLESRRALASPLPVPFQVAARPVHSLHDAALTLLDGAIGTLGSGQDDAAVHAVRKSCKRIRAALCLMREDLGPGEYRRENSQIRDATRGLTAVRDAFILRKTLGTLPTGPLALQRGLNSEYRREWRALQRRGADSALGHLTASRERLIDLPSTESETASAIAGVTRVYRAGRKALRKARQRDDEALHAWRKQANDLLNQSELLKAVFNAKFKKLSRRADKLATALGDDHDLSVLTAKLRVYGAPNRSLLKKIKKRRSKLQARAFRLGRKLYGLAPKHLKAAVAPRLSSSNPM